MASSETDPASEEPTVTRTSPRVFCSTLSTVSRRSKASFGTLDASMAKRERKPMMWKAPLNALLWRELLSLPVMDAFELKPALRADTLWAEPAAGPTCPARWLPPLSCAGLSIAISGDGATVATVATVCSSRAGQRCSSSSATSGVNTRSLAFCLRMGSTTRLSWTNDIFLSSSRCCLSNLTGRFGCGMWQNMHSLPFWHLPCAW
mmetsp:Transcript_26734/g.62345  ORF Transcript_26734/g.62345 Transcript_26734/m.62345 type:complete len:205 (+) Transcript_26734:362-976(+)